MTERPILFQGAMVRAILNGSKTQTRRVVKPFGRDDSFVLQDYGSGWWPFRSDDGESANDRNGNETAHACPYGQPGDRLWVREGHYLHGIWSVRKDEAGKRRWTFHPNTDMGVQFTEPNGLIKGRSTAVQGWYRRPSIHMPRWASRIALEVTDVRVERLQDISEADAIAEGVEPIAAHHRPGAIATHYGAYEKLWNDINGPSSWDANPWVWVVEFRRLP